MDDTSSLHSQTSHQSFTHLREIVATLYPTLADRQHTALAAWMLEVYKAPAPNRAAFVVALQERMARDAALGSLTPDLLPILVNLAERLNALTPRVERN
jgi:hypothetical protein